MQLERGSTRAKERIPNILEDMQNEALACFERMKTKNSAQFPLKCSFHLTCTQKLVVFIYSQFPTRRTLHAVNWRSHHVVFSPSFSFSFTLPGHTHSLTFIMNWRCFCTEYINFVFACRWRHNNNQQLVHVKSRKMLLKQTTWANVAVAKKV